MLGCRSIDSLMNVSIDSLMNVSTKLLPDQRGLLEVGTYMRLMGKLIYLTVVRSIITFAVSVVSQFLSARGLLGGGNEDLRYLKKAPGRGLLYLDHGHTRVAGFLGADWARCSFDRRFVSFLEEILCHGKARSRVWSLSPLQN